VDSEKNIVRHSPIAGQAPEEGAAEGQPSDLLRQAAGWARVARDAYAHCRKGAEAEKALLQRWNRSGE